ITVAAGAEAQVGDVIGYMEERAVAQDAKPSAASAKASAPKEAAKPAPAPVAAVAAPTAATPAPVTEKPAPSPPPPPSDRTSSVRESLPPHAFARVMPSARRVMAERGLKESDVEATGPGGRVLKEDALRAEKAPAAPTSPVHAEAAIPLAGRGEEVVKMSPMRRRIAERLVESQQTAALLTTFNEIDMTAVLELRK